MSRGPSVQHRRCSRWFVAAAAAFLVGLGAQADAGVIGPARAVGEPSGSPGEAARLRAVAPATGAGRAAVAGRRAGFGALRSVSEQEDDTGADSRGGGDRRAGRGFPTRNTRAEGAGPLSFGGRGRLPEGIRMPSDGLAAERVASFTWSGQAGNRPGRRLPLRIVAPDLVVHQPTVEITHGFTAVSPVGGFNFRGEVARRHIIPAPGVLGLLGAAAVGFMASRRLRRRGGG